MLHNTGPYGPNETPVNMGAPINISQLSTPMNMVQNLNHLGKMPPQVPSPGGGHFNLPNYPSYGHPGANITPQMHPFQNYHSLSFQPSYMPQSSSVMQNSSWQNAMLPMSLNMHGDHTPNALNYPHIDKLLPQTMNYKDEHYSTKTTLNIPQVPNKVYQKPSEPDPSAQNLISDSYKPYSFHKNEQNIDNNMKSPEGLLFDNTRRKNLENTVRLIENILINTTKNRDEHQASDAEHNDDDNSRSNDTKEIQSVAPNDYKSRETGSIDDGQNYSGDDDELDTDMEGNLDDSHKDNEKNDDCKNDGKSYTKENTVVPKKGMDNERVREEKTPQKEEETIELVINPIIKLEPEEDLDRQVTVKIEPVNSWTDTDSTSPFHRDMNGVTREDASGNIDVVDGETSLEEALAVTKSGQTSDTYYECPHCGLLFLHPKRLLIHAKWHSFGNTAKRRRDRSGEQEDRTLPSRVRECKACDKRISGWKAWKAHQATHGGPGFRCDECPKRFKYSHSLDRHRETHLGVPLSDIGFQCNACPKKFKYAQSLSKHKDTHLEKTHACPECPKKFGSQALLKVHLKSHERARQGATFHCTFCGKSFYDKFNLQIHERTHTNERPFVCEICNATFGCNSNLSRHLKVSHSASKPHVCDSCGRSFSSALIRDRHARRHHGDPGQFRHACALCPSRYLKQVDLKKHMYKVHPKQSEKAK